MKSLNRNIFFKHGFLIQTGKNDFLVGQGPFIRSEKPMLETFLQSDFFMKERKPWVKPDSIFSFSRKDLEEVFIEKYNSHNSLTCIKSPISFMSFQNTFYNLKYKIKLKNLEKAVIVFSETFSSDKIEVSKLLSCLIQNLKHNKSRGFLYGFWDSEKGILGFTPEKLISIKENRISSVALGGTSQKGVSLLQSKKDIKEHRFILKSILETFKDEIEWNQSDLYEREYGNLKHLCIDLDGICKNKKDPFRLIKQIHPTAALGGYPKQKAWNWLQSQKNQHNRFLHGAPFGFLNHKGEFFSLVAIRGIQWKNSEFRISAGVGITEESNLITEWNELHLKIKSIKKLFYNLL